MMPFVWSIFLCVVCSWIHLSSSFFPLLTAVVPGWELQIAGALLSFVCPWLRIMIMTVHAACNSAGCWRTAFWHRMIYLAVRKRMPSTLLSQTCLVEPDTKSIYFIQFTIRCKGDRKSATFQLRPLSFLHLKTKTYTKHIKVIINLWEFNKSFLHILLPALPSFIIYHIIAHNTYVPRVIINVM